MLTVDTQTSVGFDDIGTVTQVIDLPREFGRNRNQR